ncbi:HNH endonuclease [Prolixibacter denitrificans]|nr:HNH endonuclease [Prolixibacter denitrificans]
MKSITPDLKSYKKRKADRKIVEFNLNNKIDEQKKLKQEIERYTAERITEETEKNTQNLIKRNRPFTYYIYKGSFFIGLFIGFFLYSKSPSMPLAIGISFGSWILIRHLSWLRFRHLKEGYKSQANKEALINGPYFREDFTRKDILLSIEIPEIKKQMEKANTELHEIENKIINKADKLLKDDFLTFVLSDNFYNSTDWGKVRNWALGNLENRCVFCGSMENLSVDHIYPRSKYPDKALDPMNTQILCSKCNSSKGNRIKPNNINK